MTVTIIAIVIGLVLGAAWGEAFGAVTGALLGWLVVRSFRQEREIAALREAMAQRAAAGGTVPARVASPREGAAVPPAAPATPSPQGAAAAGAPEARSPAAASAGLAPAATQAATGVAAPASLAPPAAPRTASAPASVAAASPSTSRPATPGLVAITRAWLLGGNTIVKAGVGILFIGLAFLAKFATEHVQVPIEMRLAGIGGVAVVLLGLGWRLRSARPGYAQVLQGGAVAVLYLTLFVAFRFYGVLAAGPVFALMALVAALAAALAVLQDARPLAVIGALGGFAAPLLVSTGSGNQVALFSYYLVLDLGIAAVAWHKTWRALNLIGFLGTFIVGTAWGVMRYEPEQYASSQAFLIAYFLLFSAILLMPARHQQDSAAGTTPRSDTWVQGFLLFGLPTITFVLQHGLVRHTEYGTAISALVLAAFYVGMARAMRSRTRLAVTFDASLAIAIVFLTLVIPFALDARSTAGAWALEGAGLVWLGLRQARLLPRLFGYALLLLAGVAMLWGHGQHGPPTAVFNATLFNAAMAAVASIVAAYFVHRAALAAEGGAGPLAKHEAAAQPLLIAWATLWAVVAVAVQVDTFVPIELSASVWLVSASGIALAFTLLCTRLRWPQAAAPAMLHSPLLAVGTLGLWVNQLDPAADGGWWAWPIALASHLAVLWWAAPSWPRLAQTALHALGALVLAALGALQGRAVTATWGEAASAWGWLGWLVVPAVMLMGLPRPGAARRWPVRAVPSAYQGTAAGVITAGLLLWTLLANVASNGAARPLPYLPLVNPLDIGVGVALLAAWLWLHSAAARDTIALPPKLPVALLGAVGFVWLNAMLVRGFHHFGDVPFRTDAWVRSLAVQTGITLLWASTALVLMWLSARRALRLPWMVGAALLAAVVFKLLLIDLSGTGTVTRIVSFIGVGVLMLVIGYVAPLPAQAATKGDARATP